ncbi:cytochrome P450 [Flagelloscypha sp. PMI_526]|nr:cytochrome P450 [Flagelloscypha sp. PMI_526]
MFADNLSFITPLQAVTTTVAVYLSAFLVTLVRRRLEWRKHNYPGPPHDFLWGHLKAFHKVYQLHPSDSDEKGNLHWSNVRKALNPGFKKGHLERSWTSDIVEGINRMIEKLDKRVADQEIFGMTDYLTDATCDIILKIILSQSDPTLRTNILKILSAQLNHVLTHNRYIPALDRWNSLRRYSEWRRSTAMNSLLGPIIDEHIAEHAHGVVKEKMDVVDCALADHSMSKSNLLGQVRTFIFAGYTSGLSAIIVINMIQDTTSVTLAWAFYYLAENPILLLSVREELQRVFGPMGTEAEQIVQNPQILNELKVVNTILKETLRLHPPATSVREGPKDYFIQHPKSKEAYPVEGFLLWVNHYILHRDSDIFPDPDSFNPNRWLDSHGDPISTPLAWQPFSRGPKNCIGMELALLEQRITLALTARKFTFEYMDSKAPYPVYRVTSVPNNLIPLRVKHRISE